MIFNIWYLISQNLNIDIKGEANKRNVFRLIQKHIDGIEGEEHFVAIKGDFEKELVADFVTEGNKEDVPTSRVSDKVTDGNSLYSLLGGTGIDVERTAFHEDFKIRGFIGLNGLKATQIKKY